MLVGTETLSQRLDGSLPVVCDRALEVRAPSSLSTVAAVSTGVVVVVVVVLGCYGGGKGDDGLTTLNINIKHSLIAYTVHINNF